MAKLLFSYPHEEGFLQKKSKGIIKPIFILLFSCILIMIGVLPVMAQQTRTIKGIVTDKLTQPVPGANVVVKGTSNGTITDVNGKFAVEVSGPDAIIVISYLGYAPQEITVGNQENIDVTILEDAQNIDEVVVLGYGTQKKKDVTGAVSVLSSKEFDERPNTQFGNAIEGKAPGVQVIRPSGQPQAGFSIRVRGTSTITAGSEPLYLVDGVPTTSINEINPADIESMTILKDASSTAIYGASGSNGVVLITTKRGGNQKTKISFDTYLGTSKVWKNLDVLNASQYKDLMTEMGQTVDWNLYPYNNNWQDKVFRTAHSQNYQLSATGGNENTNFYVSSSWMKQEGVVITNQVDRLTFKTNLDHKVGKILKIGTSISYNRWKDVDVNENWKYGAINSIITGAPVTDVYNADGTFAINPFIQDLENPVALIIKNEHAYINNRFNGNVYAEVNILESLKFRSMFGYEQLNSTYNSWVDPYRSREGRGFDGLASLANSQKSYWISENTLTFNKIIDKHSLNALVGFVTSATNSDNSSIDARGFGSDGVHTVNGGSERNASAWVSERRNVSFLSRVNYGYDDKYLFTANFRADASSVFGATNNVWGYFPSFSAGWRISKENFFSGLDFINDLKLRAGWGEVGNDQVGDYASYGLVSTGGFYVSNGSVVSGTYQSTMENKNLKWETTKQSNIGFDLAALDNRILFTTDFYIKNTMEMLLDRPIPASLGIPGDVATKNVGEMQNQGIEFMVESKNLVNTLKWNTSFNISFNRSEVVSLDGGTIKVGYISDRGDVAVAMENQPLGLFYGYVSDGVDPATGDMKYRDLDNSGDLSDGDKTIIGNSNPKFTWGLTNTFSYKNWNLSFFIQGVQGNDIFNATRIETEGLMDETSQLATVLNRWTTPGQVTDIPRATYGDNTNSLISSRFVEDGSYIRLKSLTLGYDFSKNLLSKLKMNRLYLYLTCENLLTFTKYSGFDPEVSLYSRSSDNSLKNIAPGVDYGTYPQSRDIIFGLNITF